MESSKDLFRRHEANLTSLEPLVQVEEGLTGRTVCLRLFNTISDPSRKTNWTIRIPGDYPIRRYISLLQSPFAQAFMVESNASFVQLDLLLLFQSGLIVSLETSEGDACITYLFAESPRSPELFVNGLKLLTMHFFAVYPRAILYLPIPVQDLRTNDLAAKAGFVLHSTTIYNQKPSNLLFLRQAML
jgi:hypothetical protein